MKLAGNQPYFFPYLGFFQLINSVDYFILDDLLNYIKGGWINRNNILLNGEKKLFTISLKNASPHLKINQVPIVENQTKFLKIIRHAYSKAPHFKEVFPLIENIMSLNSPESLISELASASVTETSKYLGIKTNIEIGSVAFQGIENFEDLKKEKRIFKICEIYKANIFINAIGGMALYDKETFRNNGIDLRFLKCNHITYKQFDNVFVPNLSIIDVLMFNSVNDIKNMLNDCTFI